MEDLDPPRESPEAARQILHALEILELNWDGEVLYQSQRHAAYAEALSTLQQKHLLFPCTCSRRKLHEKHDGIYPGTCRNRSLDDPDLIEGDYALRCCISDVEISFNDLLQGPQCQKLERDVGDFIVKRRDGLYAYQLAVVIDDAFQEISHVIRGMDLLDSTPRQIYLQRQLNLPQPRYGHIPLIVNREGQKLSKQHHAPQLDFTRPSFLLYQGLQFLQQKPDPALLDATPAEILGWAISHWEPARLENLTQLDEHQYL